MVSSDSTLVHLNDFESNLKTMWQSLQIREDFCDMVLACDNKQILTHKVVISCSSPVLRSVLKLNIHQHPLIFLRGVEYNDLQNLLTYIYQGSINIPDKDLGSFLRVAKDLQVIGLSEVDETNFIPKSESKESVEKPFIELSEEKKVSEAISKDENKKIHNSEPITFPYIEDKKEDFCDDHVNYFSSLENNQDHKTENNASNLDSLRGGTFICDLCNKGYPYLKNLNRHKATMHEGIQYACDQCDFVSKQAWGLKTHVESVHLKVYKGCNQCDKEYTSPSALSKHKATEHLGVRHQCHHCGYKFKSKQARRKHIGSAHQDVL